MCARDVSNSDQLALLLNFPFIRRMSRLVDVANDEQQYKLNEAFAKMDEMSIDSQTCGDFFARTAFDFEEPTTTG